MKPFEYVAPATLPEALRHLAENGQGARILAGGTDLLIELRKPAAPSLATIVDIGRLQGLRGVRISGEDVVIGPLTTHAELFQSEVLRSSAPLLQTAAAAIGSAQIRNRGTIGGNIMNAAACADTVPPLIALGARVLLQSAAGERQVPMSEFYLKPYITKARRDELLTEIRFRSLPKSAHSAFLKLGRRNAAAIARLSVAAILMRDEDGRISEARIVPGAAFPSWRRIPEAEDLLVGCEPSRELLVQAGRKAAEAMLSTTGRRWSTEYKEPVLAIMVRRALEACCA